MNAAKDARLFVFDDNRTGKCNSSFIDFTSTMAEGIERAADHNHSHAYSACDSSLPNTKRCPQVSPVNILDTPNLESTRDSKKYVRSSYNPEQLQKLLDAFQRNKYPNADELEQMSTVLGVSAKNIKIWFQNKRARSKRRKIDESFEFTKPQLSMYPTEHPCVFPYGLPANYPCLSTVPARLSQWYTPSISPPRTTMMTESIFKPSLQYDTPVSRHDSTPTSYQGLHTPYPYFYPYQLYSPYGRVY